MAVYHRGNRVDYIKTHDIKPTQEKTIQATTETQYVLPDVGYELSQVTVLGFQGDISAENIAAYKVQDLSYINLNGGALATDTEYEAAEIYLQSLYHLIMKGNNE